jgi:hypothetical protein
MAWSLLHGLFSVAELCPGVQYVPLLRLPSLGWWDSDLWTVVRECMISKSAIAGAAATSNSPGNVF